MTFIHSISKPVAVTLASALAILATPFASGQTVASAKADILSTYDFEPSSMSYDDQARRAPSLSALWDRSRKSAEIYAAALREELSAPNNREQLYCDGGMLLLDMSKTPEDLALGTASLRKCSLAEIQHTPYFYTLHRLASRGVDTFGLQERILEKPNYSVFIVEHALTLGQDYAFLYPLLVQDETIYVPKLLSRLATEEDPVAQKSLVLALWYAATPESEDALRKLVSDPRTSSLAAGHARTLLDSLNQVRVWKRNEADLKELLSSVDASSSMKVSELRAKRRERMRSVSDEALYDLDAYTALIYRARGN